jgi:hypothetical protein
MILLIVLGGFALIFYLEFGEALLHDPRLRVSSTLLYAAIPGLLLAFVLSRLTKSDYNSFRLGVSPEGAFYENAPGFKRSATGHAPWREVYFDGTNLLVGKKSLNLWTNRGIEIFNRKELIDNFLAYIPLENRVSPDKFDEHMSHLP